MYEVAPSILESRLLGSTNIVDAAVVGIPDKENGEVRKKAGKFTFQKIIIIILSFDPSFTNFSNRYQELLSYYVQDLKKPKKILQI